MSRSGLDPSSVKRFIPAIRIWSGNRDTISDDITRQMADISGFWRVSGIVRVVYALLQSPSTKIKRSVEIQKEQAIERTW
jgi:hypothetical protein